MAKLVFHVQADYEEVIKLRNEIEKLKKELKGMDAMQSPAAFNTLNAQLSVSTKKMDELVTEAAKAGAEMEVGFKNKIFEASQSVNGFTEKIIAQKSAIGSLQTAIRKNKELYRTIVSRGGEDKELLNHIYQQEKALGKERDALFNLTQQQAEARLSVKKLRDEYALYRDDSKKTASATDGIGFSLKKAFAVIGGAALGKQLISDIIRVRGEFQAADTAIQTLLGSEEKANDLMSKVREYAKISPLEFSDVTKATQMMLGFNIEAEKVPRFLQAIGDASMGDTQRFNSLTLAFSQMSAAGKLMGQDLNQMINAGFNPLQIIADKTGKSMGQLKDEMSKGAISAEMVQQAFIDATSAGGKFYNMSENASKTITGKLSTMQDAIDSSLNEMGQKSEGVIMKGIEMTTSLIENYETVGKVLAGLVTTYGTYRTAVFITTLAMSKHTIAEIALTNARVLARRAQLALNAAMLTNPYVLMATVIAGLVATVWAFHDSTTAAEAAQKSLNETSERAKKKEEEHKQEIERLISALNDENLSSKERQDAMNKLIQRYPSIIKKYIDEEGHLREILKLKKEIAEVDGRQKTLNLQKGYENDKTRLDFLKKLKGMSVNDRVEYLHKKGNENILQWYKSMHKEALKGYKGRAALTFNEMLDFYSKRTEGKKKAYNRNVTETKIDQFSQGLGNMSTEELKSLQKELMRANKNRKSSTSVFVKSIGDYLTGTDRETLLTKVSGMVSARERSSKSNSQKTKSELDEDKKKLKQQLEAMTAQEAAGKKGLAIQKKIKAIDEQLIKFDVTGKNDKKAEQARKKAEQERKKAEREEQKRNKAETKSDDETLKLRMENRQAELDLEEETTEKKLKLIDISYDKQKSEIAKKERELAEQNKKAGTKGLNEKGLTDEQQKEIDNANNLNEKSREKQISETYKEEFAAMRDYLKEYGSFQQQKLAIAEEYSEKISKAQNAGERMTLEKQKASAIQKVEVESLKQEIDWKGLLGDVGGMFEEQIKPTLEKLKKYTESEEFKQADIQDQQVVFDLITKLTQKASDGWSGMFRNLGEATTNYREKVIALEEATEKAKKADEEYAAAKSNAGKNADTDEDVKNLGKAAIEAAENQKQAQSDVTQAQNEMSDAATRVRENLDNLKNGLQQLGSGSMSGVLSGANSIAKIFGENNLSDKIAASLSKSVGGAFGTALAGPMGGQIVEGVFALLDLFKNGIEKLFSSLIDTILGVVNGILDTLLNFKIITSIFSSVKNGLENIVNTLVKGLTFGLVKGINWSGSNAEEVAKITDRLTKSNERLRDSVDKLIDEINEYGGGIKSVESADEARKAQEAINKNTSEILKAQMRYHSAHHSNEYYWNLGWGDYRSINNTLLEYARKNGKDASNVGSLEDIYNLTPEEMDYIRTHNIEMWNKIISQGKYDKSEYWEQYADLAGSLEEITNALNESLTQISFDSLRSDFISSLMDMEKDADDFSDDFTDMLMKSVLNAKIANLLDEELEKFYEDWAERSKDGLDDDDIKYLKSEWDNIVQKGLEMRDEAAKITGYDNTSSSQQKSSGKGFETMSQDTGEELNGRFTAMYESDLRQESMLNHFSVSITEITGNMISLGYKVDGISNIVKDTRDIIANSYLELQGIRENTGAIVKPILQMQKDIAEVKQNTSRL